MQRLHILSTLESARRPPRVAPSKARKQRTPITGEGSPWQIKLLMGLMAVGIVCLMSAFALLVLDTSALRQAQAASAETAAATRSQRQLPIQADRHNPLAALMTQPMQTGPLLAPEQQAAIIENLPVDPTAPVTTPVSAQAPLPLPASPATAGLQTDTEAATLAAMPSVGSAGLRQPTSARPLLALTAPPAEHAMSQARPLPVKTAAPAAASADAQADAGSTVRRRAVAVRAKDDDVALLEAVLAHSATRQAQPPEPSADPDAPAIALARCAALGGGGAAATCRAAVCVEHPTLAACHQAP